MAAVYHASTASGWKGKLLAIAAALPDHVVVFAFQTHGRSVAAGKVGIINLKGAGREARSSDQTAWQEESRSFCLHLIHGIKSKRRE